MPLVLIVVFAGGCASPPIKELATPEWQARYAQLATTQAWAMRGKLAVSHRDKHWLLNFSWIRKGQSFDIDLYSAFGHVASFESAPEGIRARRGADEFLAATPEEALRKLLGFAAPITLMRHWVLGIPSPQLKVDKLTLNEQGFARAIAQSDWRVEYESYQRAGEVWVPQKLVVRRGEIKLTAWITAWDKVT